MKIQLKRSRVLEGSSAKEPTAAQMLDGELAVNYNANDPAIFLKDSAGKIIRIAGDNAVGNENQDIEGYPDLEDGDGTTLDGRYVKVVGDNMTGNLTLGTDKIVLNTDGTATFVGALTVTSTDVSAFTGKITTASTTDEDPDTTVVTKDYLEDYTSENLWIDGGHASSNFGGAPAEIEGGKANTIFE